MNKYCTLFLGNISALKELKREQILLQRKSLCLIVIEKCVLLEIEFE